jgi:hypothetical protein
MTCKLGEFLAELHHETADRTREFTKRLQLIVRRGLLAEPLSMSSVRETHALV